MIILTANVKANNLIKTIIKKKNAEVNPVNEIYPFH